MALKGQVLTLSSSTAVACIAIARWAEADAARYSFGAAGVLFAIVSLSLFLSMTSEFREKLNGPKRWALLASNKGTKQRKAVERLAFDFLLSGLVATVPFAAVIYSFLEASPVQQLTIHLIVAGVVVIWWFVYRQHRRNEHHREVCFSQALFDCFELTDRIDELEIESAEELQSELGNILRDARQLLLKAHGISDDRDLSLWLYMPNLLQQHFRCHALAASPSFREGAFDKVRSATVPIFALREEAGKEPAFFYGSVCGYSLLHDHPLDTGRPFVTRMDNALECEAFNPMQLDPLPKDIRSHFEAGSYLRIGLCCPDPHYPEPLSPSFVLPLFAVHRQPSFFTEYDRCLFAAVGRYVCRLLERHQSLLADEAVLRPGERAHLAHLLHHSPRHLKIDSRKEIVARGLPSNSQRYECVIDIARAARIALTGAREYKPDFYTIMTRDGSHVGVEASHRGESEVPAREFLAAHDEWGLSSVIDLLWASRVLRTVARKEDEHMFVKVEWRSLRSENSAEFLDWLVKSKTAPVVLVLPVPSESEPGVDVVLREASSREIEICYDRVTDVSEVSRAVEHEVRWIKFDIGLVNSALANEIQQKQFHRVLKDALEKKRRAIIQGLTQKNFEDAIERLTDGRDEVFLEGRFGAGGSE